jgi:hypothetical protein
MIPICFVPLIKWSQYFLTCIMNMLLYYSKLYDSWDQIGSDTLNGFGIVIYLNMWDLNPSIKWDQLF